MRLMSGVRLGNRASGVAGHQSTLDSRWHSFYVFWLVVSTPLKTISQIGNRPQIGVKIKKSLKPPPSIGLYERSKFVPGTQMGPGCFCWKVRPDVSGGWTRPSKIEA